MKKSVERSWSEIAQAAFDAYPWEDPEKKEKAKAESEMVSYGPEVEARDLPREVRNWAAQKQEEEAQATRPCYEWHGESWEEAVREFESAILSQALAANRGNATAAARALKTTPRIVSYKARQYGLERRIRHDNRQKNEE